MAIKDYDEVVPSAASMIESLRAVGYSISTAIADLVDNCITAGARSVWLDFHWAGQDSYITLRDDGEGMTEEELKSAMRPGNRNPLEVRDAGDLGRFGLGLKTASFSQARRLTVASRSGKAAVAVRRWDLDYISEHDEWRLLKFAAPGSEFRLSALSGQTRGTIVLWEQLDRLVGKAPLGDTKAQDRFLDTVQIVSRHLGMVFHRFLTPHGGKPALSIFVNGKSADHKVHPWDPFVTGHPATEVLPDEVIEFRGEKVVIKGYVLPHKDRMKESSYQAAAGPAGWNLQQGFYVYRNPRLLVAGGWLNLGFTNEEHYKLARLRVDIPNSTDAEWDIDVKKSRARPPPELQSRLRELAERVRRSAREVFVHRGQRGPTRAVEVHRVWKSTSKGGRICYRIDREHPLVKELLDMPGAQGQAVRAMLRLVEETVPVHQIWLDAAERPEVHAAPFENEPPDQVNEVMKQVYEALIVQGYTQDVSRNSMLVMEPFNQYPEAVQALGTNKR